MAQSCESVICFHSSLQTSSALSKINLFLALTSLPRTYCKTDTVCFYVSHFFVSMTLQKWLKYCHENLHSVYSLRGRTFPKFVSQLTQKQAYSDTVELNWVITQNNKPQRTVWQYIVKWWEWCWGSAFCLCRTGQLSLDLRMRNHRGVFFQDNGMDRLRTWCWSVQCSVIQWISFPKSLSMRYLKHGHLFFVYKKGGERHLNDLSQTFWYEWDAGKHSSSLHLRQSLSHFVPVFPRNSTASCLLSWTTHCINPLTLHVYIAKLHQ